MNTELTVLRNNPNPQPDNAEQIFSAAIKEIPRLVGQVFQDSFKTGFEKNIYAVRFLEKCPCTNLKEEDIKSSRRMRVNFLLKHIDELKTQLGNFCALKDLEIYKSKITICLNFSSESPEAIFQKCAKVLDNLRKKNMFLVELKGKCLSESVYPECSDYKKLVGVIKDSKDFLQNVSRLFTSMQANEKRDEDAKKRDDAFMLMIKSLNNKITFLESRDACGETFDSV